MAFNPDRVHYFQQRPWAARSPFAKHAPQARRRGSVAPGFPCGGTLVRHCPAVPPLSPLLSWSHWVSLIHTCSSLPQPSLKDFQPGLDQPGAQYGPVARLPSFPFWLKVGRHQRVQDQPTLWRSRSQPSHRTSAAKLACHQNLW